MQVCGIYSSQKSFNEEYLTQFLCTISNYAWQWKLEIWHVEACGLCTMFDQSQWLHLQVTQWHLAIGWRSLNLADMVDRNWPIMNFLFTDDQSGGQGKLAGCVLFWSFLNNKWKCIMGFMKTLLSAIRAVQRDCERVYRATTEMWEIWQSLLAVMVTQHGRRCGLTTRLTPTGVHHKHLLTPVVSLLLNGPWKVWL